MRRKAEKGEALLLAVVLLAVVMGLVAAFVNYHAAVNRATRSYVARGQARQAAMAGIDKALWCLNQTDDANCGGTSGLNYVGEVDVPVGDDSWFTTGITTVAGNQKTITSTGHWPSPAEPQATVVMKADAITNTTDASFNYGVQVGNGGFELSNNAFVVGNIYAHGNVVAGSNAYIDGDVWVAGGTALAADQQQNVNNEDYVFGQSDPVEDIAQSFRISGDDVVNKISLYIRKVGNPSNRTVRIVTDDAGVPSTTTLGTGTLQASTVTTSFAWVDVAFPTPPPLVGGETYWLVVDGSNSNSRYWVIGSLPNNGYGNGIGMYSADWDDDPWSDAGRDLAFKVWTGGVTTGIYGAEIYGEAHANTIQNADIDGDAYYQSISGSSVGGTEYPGSPDPGPEDFPISEGNIAQWKVEAGSGGTIVGNKTLSGTESLGPVKITGDLIVQNNVTLNITGTIYVQGDVLLSNNVIAQLDPGYGANSGMIIADGHIEVSNNVEFYGSGDPSSYILVLSTNPSLDNANPAVLLSNNSDNSIFYASKGVVAINNNAALKEVTGFKIFLDNNASVTYESGLANINFSSGPSGGWSLKAGSVREIP